MPVMACQARRGGSLTSFILDLIPFLRQSLVMFNFPSTLQGSVPMKTSCVFYPGAAKLVTVSVMQPSGMGQG